MLAVKNGPKTIPIRRLPTVIGSEKTNNELEKIGAKIKEAPRVPHAILVALMWGTDRFHHS
jgi:hypothetical protein